jgi:hypothetical protein
MLPWMPRRVPPSTVPNPQPQPRFHALRTIFRWAYWTQPAWVWDLPLPQQSDALLRSVMQVCRSYQSPCRGLDYMSTDPEVHLGEYLVICALANVDPDEFLADLHMDHPDDPFLAAGLDPDGRQGRAPAPAVSKTQ